MNKYKVADKHKTKNLICCFPCFLGPASGDSAKQQKEVAQEEDREEVFTVELCRGPHGLGLALVDGTVCGILRVVHGFCSWACR